MAAVPTGVSGEVAGEPAGPPAAAAAAPTIRPVSQAADELSWLFGEHADRRAQPERASSTSAGNGCGADAATARPPLAAPGACPPGGASATPSSQALEELARLLGVEELALLRVEEPARPPGVDLACPHPTPQSAGACFPPGTLQQHGAAADDGSGRTAAPASLWPPDGGHDSAVPGALPPPSASVALAAATPDSGTEPAVATQPYLQCSHSNAAKEVAALLHPVLPTRMSGPPLQEGQQQQQSEQQQQRPAQGPLPSGRPLSSASREIATLLGAALPPEVGHSKGVGERPQPLQQAQRQAQQQQQQQQAQQQQQQPVPQGVGEAASPRSGTARGDILHERLQQHHAQAQQLLALLQQQHHTHFTELQELLQQAGADAGPPVAAGSDSVRLARDTPTPPPPPLSPRSPPRDALLLPIGGSQGAKPLPHVPSGPHVAPCAGAPSPRQSQQRHGEGQQHQQDQHQQRQRQQEPMCPPLPERSGGMLDDGQSLRDLFSEWLAPPSDVDS
uniref:Uncharacterized protein n=1 Tax=Chlamydomonas euryale TaxID=1486919 RepID=A0A7R9Z1B9_9CHLO